MKSTRFAVCALFGSMLMKPLMWSQTEVKIQVDPVVGEHIVVPQGVEVGRCLSSPAQLDKCFLATVNGIKYTIAYRRNGSMGNVVTYVHTDDPNFRSPEGLHIGDITTVANPEDIIAAPGFEIYGKKGKGWIPVVGFNSEVTVVQNQQGDQKQQVKTLKPTSDNPVRLRIESFTMRGNIHH